MVAKDIDVLRDLESPQLTQLMKANDHNRKLREQLSNTSIMLEKQKKLSEQRKGAQVYHPKVGVSSLGGCVKIFSGEARPADEV